MGLLNMRKATRYWGRSGTKRNAGRGAGAACYDSEHGALTPERSSIMSDVTKAQAMLSAACDRDGAWKALLALRCDDPKHKAARLAYVAAVDRCNEVGSS